MRTADTGGGEMVGVGGKEDADRSRVEFQGEPSPQRLHRIGGTRTAPWFNYKQQEIAFNQCENKWKCMPEHPVFEEMSGTLSIFYLLENSGRNPTEISPVISTQ